ERAEHVFEAAECALVDAEAGLTAEHVDQWIALVDELDLDLAIVEPAVAQHAAEFLARRVGALYLRLGRALREAAPAATRQQQIEQPLLGGVLRARADLARFFVAHDLDRDLDEIANDRVDVAPDVADLGELRRFHFQERRARELRE